MCADQTPRNEGPKPEAPLLRAAQAKASLIRQRTHAWLPPFRVGSVLQRAARCSGSVVGSTTPPCKRRPRVWGAGLGGWGCGWGACGWGGGVAPKTPSSEFPRLEKGQRGPSAHVEMVAAQAGDRSCIAKAGTRRTKPCSKNLIPSGLSAAKSSVKQPSAGRPAARQAQPPPRAIA
jgi:hypothetical protein